jgi:hypothetical protein
LAEVVGFFSELLRNLWKTLDPETGSAAAQSVSPGRAAMAKVVQSFLKCLLMAGHFGRN